MHRGFVDIDEIEYPLSGTVSVTRGKVRPIVEGMRRHYSFPGLYEWFEYLYECMREREQARV